MDLATVVTLVGLLVDTTGEARIEKDRVPLGICLAVYREWRYAHAAGESLMTVFKGRVSVVLDVACVLDPEPPEAPVS